MSLKLAGRKLWFEVCLAIFMLAVTAGTLIAQAAIGAGAPGTVTITGSICDPAQTTICNLCLVDLGTTATWCWSTKCDEKDLGFKACRTWKDSTQPCVSNTVKTIACSNCKSWKCSVLNPPKPPASTTYTCDVNNCACPDIPPDYNGSWSWWLLCP